MSETVVPAISWTELYRLHAAYASIEDPTIRKEFLRTIEAWASDQHSYSKEI